MIISVEDNIRKKTSVNAIQIVEWRVILCFKSKKPNKINAAKPNNPQQCKI